MNPTSTMDPTATDPATDIANETVLPAFVEAQTTGRADAASAAVRVAVAGAARDASSSATPEDVRTGLAWAKSVITAWCRARVLAVDLDPILLTFDQQTVPALEATFTVATVEQARRLAVRSTYRATQAIGQLRQRDRLDRRDARVRGVHKSQGSQTRRTPPRTAEAVHQRTEARS